MPLKNRNSSKKFKFINIANLNKNKNQSSLIKAFSKVAEQRDDVSLLIVGESFWNTLDSKKLSTRIKNATFGLAKKLFLKKQDDEGDYNPLALIEELNLNNKVFVDNDFVPNEEVHKYFQDTDFHPG